MLENNNQMTLPLEVELELPECDNYKFLPNGIYDCAIEELQYRFGNISPRRFDLFIALKDFLKDLSEYSDDIEEIYIDGQFVSDITNTSDVDILIVTKNEDVELQLIEFADKIDREGIDVKIACKESDLLNSYLLFFSFFEPRKHRELADQKLKKGFLRLKQ